MLFERPEERLPLHDAIDFYKHAHGWSNRLIAGDSYLDDEYLIRDDADRMRTETRHSPQDGAKILCF